MKKYYYGNRNLNFISCLLLAVFFTLPAVAQRERQDRGRERSESVQRSAQMPHRDNVRNVERRQVSTSRPAIRQESGTRVQRPTREVAMTRNNNTVINNRTQINNRIQINNRQNIYNSRSYPRGVYDARNPGWRYSSFPQRNTVISVVPAGYSVYNYGGNPYRYYNGVFYRPYQNSFMVIAPPIGIFINTMPYGYRRIYVNDDPYYYYYGTYYQYRNSNYYVVSPPIGAIVESLPSGYQTLTIDGETYYTIDGAQYKPVVQDNGQVWYQVIKAN